MRRLITLFVLSPLAACLGTIESLHVVKGEAPQGANCEILISEARSGRVTDVEKVQGSFRVQYVASGPFPPKLNIAAYCDQQKIKELKNVAARGLNEIDLGKLAP